MGDSKINLSYITPVINGPSDHDAQILTINNVYSSINGFPLQQCCKGKTRLTDYETLMNFFVY